MSIVHKGKSILRENMMKKLTISFLSGIGTIIYLFFYVKYNLYKKGIWYIIPYPLLITLSTIYFKKYMILRAGFKGEKRTLKLLKKLPSSYHVFNNVFIKKDNRSKEVDLIVVGESGVSIIEVKNYKGKIFGNGDDLKWIQHKRGKNGGQYQKNIDNPIIQLNEQIYFLHEYLKDHNINSFIKGAVFFSNRQSEINIGRDFNKVISSEEELICFIKRDNKYEYSSKTINSIINLLEKNQR